jgi:hypothetical protein
MVEKELHESLLTTAQISVDRAHRHKIPPPPLPDAQQLYKSLSNEVHHPRERPSLSTSTKNAVGAPTMVNGLPGMLRFPDGSVPGVFREERLVEIAAKERSEPFAVKTGPKVSPQRQSNENSRENSVQRSTTSSAPLAAAVFKEIPSLHVTTRNESNKNTTTFGLVQAVPNTSSFAPAEDRFNGQTRGLGATYELQIEKMQHQATAQQKTHLLRQKAAELAEARNNAEKKLAALDEGRIKSKSLQLETYKQRLSAYKFTK